MNVTRTPPNLTAIEKVFVNATTLGSNTVVAARAPTGRIRVIGLAVISTAANTVTFASNASPITASFDFGVNGGLVLPFNEHGWFETNAGEALNVTLSAATKVAIQVVFIMLP